MSKRTGGAKAERRLLIDVGNGRAKLALATQDRLLKRRETATRTLSATALNEATAGWEYDRVVVCSVVPKATALLRRHFGSGLTELTHLSPLGFGFRYPEPATVGPDRLADVLALSALYARKGQPGIVVDFGTAVTFNVLSADRHYLGGVIAPGLRLMTDYLHERTALLPAVELREPSAAIGTSTESAILAGAALGYRGMVRGILQALKAELGPRARPFVVATGGDADWITRGMKEVHATDPDLTLHGLRLLGNLTSP
jgi:type III pantothenate kinase